MNPGTTRLDHSSQGRSWSSRCNRKIKVSNNKRLTVQPRIRQEQSTIRLQPKHAPIALTEPHMSSRIVFIARNSKSRAVRLSSEPKIVLRVIGARERSPVDVSFILITQCSWSRTRLSITRSSYKGTSSTKPSCPDPSHPHYPPHQQAPSHQHSPRRNRIRPLVPFPSAPLVSRHNLRPRRLFTNIRSIILRRHWRGGQRSCKGMRIETADSLSRIPRVVPVRPVRHVGEGIGEGAEYWDFRERGTGGEGGG